MTRTIYDPRRNPDTPRELLPGCPWPDVFSSGMPGLAPGPVYIVGSGPEGLGHYDSIPVDAATIALNSMVNHGRAWSYWVAFDHRIVEMDWWGTFTPPEATTRLYSARLANRLFSPGAGDFPRVVAPHYVFSYMPGITAGSFVDGSPLLMAGVLRGGMTVAGIAMQLAIHGGARDIVLCGVDMYGTGHWDGFVNPDSVVYGGVWEWSRLINAYMRRMERELGVTFRSLSKTALEVEQP